VILGRYSFAGNEFIKSITFEAGSELRRIEGAAFRSSSLKSISLPASLEYVYGSAFARCGIESAEDVTLDPRNLHLAYESGCLIHKASKMLIRAFARDSAYLIPPDISVIGMTALSDYWAMISIDCPSSVVKLRDFVFEGHSLRTSLNSIHLPASVRKIDGRSFYRAMLETISLDPANPYFALRDDCIIELSTDKLVHCFCQRPSFSIPGRVAILGKGALAGSPIVEVTIDLRENSRLVRIEKFAFYQADVISLTLPAGVEFIDGQAFEGSHIQEVRIGEGNRHFEMKGGFLVRIGDQRLVRYFGPDCDVAVPREIGLRRG
jgi:hypothetical protein